ncbi:MAG: hypothetical protein AAF065_13180 [Verrucomicrobiota bacterium]
MKHSTIIGLTAIGFSVSLLALPENFRIEKDLAAPTQPLKLKFWGNPNVYYVIESTTDLTIAWDQYFYAVKGVSGAGGTGQAEAVQFAPFAGTDKAFFKLLGDPDSFSLLGLTDHDGDGIATALELDNSMNAVVAETIVDSEPDGLPDYWEIFYFEDLSRNGEGDFDNDGILDKFEWQARTNPIVDQANTFIAESTGLVEYTYTSLGHLNTSSGSTNLAFTFDEEGNLESAQ